MGHTAKYSLAHMQSDQVEPGYSDNRETSCSMYQMTPPTLLSGRVGQ